MKTIRFFIVMGVSRSGKTNVGKALAAHLGWDFYDADDFHSLANVEKWQTGSHSTIRIAPPGLLRFTI
jgi:gluconokinase